MWRGGHRISFWDYLGDCLGIPDAKAIPDTPNSSGKSPTRFQLCSPHAANPGTTPAQRYPLAGTKSSRRPHFVLHREQPRHAVVAGCPSRLRLPPQGQGVRVGL